MHRRSFITLLGASAAASPLAARAQQSERMRRIGVLMNGTGTEITFRTYLNAFTDTLRKLGWRDRADFRIDIRWTGADADGIKAHATELVSLAPDLILASSSGNLAAVLRATRSIPIVFVVVSDPVAQGFVASLARPGDNITGFGGYEASIAGKWADLLKQMAGRLARIAVMFNPDSAPQSPLFLRAVQTAAPSLGLEIVATPVHDVTEIEPAIASASRQPNTGLMLLTGAFTQTNQDHIIALAARHRLPTIAGDVEFVRKGGLMSYTIDYEPQFRQAAFYVDRFLKGAKLADLPVQLPTTFRLAINLKAAAALGIEVPLGLLLSVDEVIE